MLLPRGLERVEDSHAFSGLVEQSRSVIVVHYQGLLLIVISQECAEFFLLRKLMLGCPVI